MVPLKPKSTDVALIYGRRPVIEWLQSRLSVRRLLIAETAKMPEELERLAQESGLKPQRVPAAQLARIARTDKHQGVAAEVELPPYSTVDDVLAVAERRREPPLIAVLDGVQDPHNLGAVLRTADAAAVHGIVIAKDQAAGISPAVVKASAGAAAFVPLVQETNISRFLQEMKKEGFWVTGTAEDGDREFYEADLKGPSILVLGSEGRGMRHLVREQCDFVVRIPMCGRVASLNISVAAALLFYEARRQRR